MPLRREGEPVPNLDERVAYLEGRIEDHAGAVAELRADVRELRAEIRELRADMTRLYHALDTKIIWVIGTQMAMALAIIGVLLKR